MEFHLTSRKEAAKPQTPSSAAEVIGGNEDLVLEILKRVPVKTLTRWRSVCKAWLFLISSPRFSLLYCQQQSIHDSKLSGLIIICRYKPDLVRYTPINNNNNESESLEMFPPYMSVTNLGVHVEDSCNGLILISSQGREPWDSKVYHVSNPISKKISTLPQPSYSSFPYAYLFFDPLKSLHYRVVLLRTKYNIITTYCYLDIYSSETNSWWSTKSTPPYPHLFEASYAVLFQNGVSCNGNIHWLSSNPDINSLYFDVDHKTFHSMPSPPFERALESRFFGVSGGHLHAGMYYYDGAGGYNFVVWEMECDYSNWSPKYRFCINQLFVDMEMVVCDDTLSLLNIIRGKDERDVFLVLLVGSHIIYYNIKDNTYNKLQSSFLPENDLSTFKFSRACPFMETLFPV